jgi:hypothetical protein
MMQPHPERVRGILDTPLGCAPSINSTPRGSQKRVPWLISLHRSAVPLRGLQFRLGFHELGNQTSADNTRQSAI